MLTICLSLGLSSAFVTIGDQLVVKDKFAQALAFYHLAKVTNPFAISIQKRIAAAAFSYNDILHPELSEETSSPKMLASLPKGAYVLGATTQVPVLMYHYIRVNPDAGDKVGFNLSVTPYNFSAQLDWLQMHGYHTITLDALGANLLYKVPLPEKPVVITLDDGYKDAYTDAFPILKAHDMQAVDFVITGFVDLPRYLSWDEIAEMQKSGVFEIESHTVNHPALTYLTDEQVMKELVESKKDLEKHLGIPVNWLAYPFGNVNEHVASFSPKAGYIGAFGTQLGTFQSTQEIFTLPRVRIGGGDSPESMGSRLPWN